MAGMDELESLEVQALLEDYRTASRRDHCSRADFAAGWRAAKLRFEHSGFERKKPENRRLKIAV